MQKFFLTTAAALALSTGAALAAEPGPNRRSGLAGHQAAEASAYSGYYMVMSFRMRARRRTAGRGPSGRAATGTWHFLSRLSVSAGRGRR